MKLKAIVGRMLRMCPAAWTVFIRSLQLCCFLLFCSFMLLLKWNGSMTDGYEHYMTAMALEENCQALLLVAVLVSVCIEDRQS